MAVSISDLVGKTLVSAKGKKGDSEILFEASDGSRYRMFHDQDCCESVQIEDICGDLDDLIGVPILRATEDTNRDRHPDGAKVKVDVYDSFTWTFYNIATIKGHVTIRWLGTSNGCYSEAVAVERTNPRR